MKKILFAKMTSQELLKLNLAWFWSLSGIWLDDKSIFLSEVKPLKVDGSNFVILFLFKYISCRDVNPLNVNRSIDVKLFPDKYNQVREDNPLNEAG